MSSKNLRENLFLDNAYADAVDLAPWLRTIIVLLAIVAAIITRVYLLPADADCAFLAFYPAVALSALIFSARTTLFTVFACALAACCFYVPPYGISGAVSRFVEMLLPLAEFFIFGIIAHVLRKRISRQKAEARANKRLLQAIFESNPDALAIIDSTGIIVMTNLRAGVLLGYDQGELRGSHCELVVPQRLRINHPLLHGVFKNKNGTRTPVHAAETHVLRKSGEEIDVAISASVVKSDRGTLIVCTLRDTRASNKAEAELRISATAFESNDGIIVTDADGIIQRVNQAFTRISGYTLADLVGKTTDHLRSKRHDDEFYRGMRKTIQESGGWKGEVWGRRKNGEEYPEWLNVSAVKNKEGKVTHFVGSHSDITDRKQAEAEIKDLAFFDQLTGLPNRTLFSDRLKQAIRVSSRSGNYGALLFIDLDNFKELNDTMGHDVGDRLLRQVAKRLIGFMREVDTVARLGGDEFVIVLSDLSEAQREAVNFAETVAEKILGSLRSPYLLGNVTHTCTASIGATLFKERTDSFEDLMKQADLAMYKSKAVGRNTVRFFDPAMEAAIMERAALEKDLRHGLAHNHFMLYYQAQVVGEGHLMGAEALVRWRHPERGIVSPIEFIQVTEESGLILQLGHWVLETACRQLKEWSNRPEMERLTLAVNVSASQFRQPDFVEQVLAVIESTRANPRRLKLELTESLLVDDVPKVIEKMNALKSKGVSFTLDDFGTGYSSLSYLKRMPLDQLKIDQSFVHDVLTDQSDAAIAKTIVALAKSLDLSVIAEGVETDAQRDFLARNGCHDYQGFLFSRPLPIEQFEDLALQGA